MGDPVYVKMCATLTSPSSNGAACTYVHVHLVLRVRFAVRCGVRGSIGRDVVTPLPEMTTKSTSTIVKPTNN